VNPLTFARDLARLETELKSLADWCPGHGERRAAAAAESYLHLLGLLTEIGDDDGTITAIVVEAIEVYQATDSRWRPVEAAEWQREEDRQQRRVAAHAEAMRRHEVAITAECSYCGAAPGRVCRTAGPKGFGNPKGVYDHADRYRAAVGLLGPPGGDSP
jgi:hypothetical protein